MSSAFSFTLFSIFSLTFFLYPFLYFFRQLYLRSFFILFHCQWLFYYFRINPRLNPWLNYLHCRWVFLELSLTLSSISLISWTFFLALSLTFNLMVHWHFPTVLPWWPFSWPYSWWPLMIILTLDVFRVPRKPLRRPWSCPLSSHIYSQETGNHGKVNKYIYSLFRRST